MKGCTKLLMSICLLVLVLALSTVAYATIVPSGPTKITNLSTETAPVKGAVMLNTTGGTFTTLRINITSPTYRWKAYAGNVSGRLTLDDSKNYTIYDWSITTVAGEVYATRSPTLVSWASIKCANSSTIRSEEKALNISVSSDDSINRTFNKPPYVHDEFYTAQTKFTANSCPATATYVSDIKQTSLFQEVVLYDSSRIVYASLLENHAKGFNNKYYDFQLILPESGLESQSAPTLYYFYVELS